MRSFSKFATVACSVLALATSSGTAAAQTYSWTLTGLDTGSGTFFTGKAANGGLDVYGFTGMIDNVAVTETGGNPGVETLSPDGYFQYDNLVYPAGPQVLDLYGILMNYNGTYANLWGNSPTDFAFYTETGPQNSSGDSFTISFVPEPTAVAIFGAGLLGLAFLRRQRQAG